MTQYSSAEDARQAIVDALGEHANTHDIDAILHATFEVRYDRNEDGQILANSYRYEQTLTEEDFWTVVEKHAIENTREKERKQANRDTNAPKDKTEEITIYSVESCQGCRITAQMLEKAGIPFQVVDLSQRPDLVEEFRAQGLIQAPVVEHQGQRTAGFRPDRIRAIVSSMNAPDATAIHAASQSGAQRPTPHTMPASQRTPNTPTR